MGSGQAEGKPGEAGVEGTGWSTVTDAGREWLGQPADQDHTAWGKGLILWLMRN